METTTVLQTFTAFNLPENLQHALARAGYVTPTAIQAATIPHAIDDRDVLGVAETGSGKTLAFAIPMLSHLLKNPNARGLVLVPTRELAYQCCEAIMKVASACQLSAGVIIGGQSFEIQKRKLRSRPRMIIATPGRLNDHLRQRTISLAEVSFFVLDEVDRMLDMGFGPQIKDILAYVPKRRQTLVFSATMPSDIQRAADAMLTDPVKVQNEAANNKPALSVTETDVRSRSTEEKKNLLLKEVEGREGKIIIFTNTQRRSESVGQFLNDQRFRASILHGGMNQGQRRRSFEAFASGNNRILVATDLAGRGIDVKGVGHVINFDLPPCKEDYIHRIGRTGRMGETGQAVNFVLPSESSPSTWFIAGAPTKSSGGYGAGFRRSPKGGSRQGGGFNRRSRPAR